jgi:hypothetical protein
LFGNADPVAELGKKQRSLSRSRSTLLLLSSLLSSFEDKERRSKERALGTREKAFSRGEHRSGSKRRGEERRRRRR